MATLTRDLTYAQLTAEIAAGTLNEGEGIWITDYQTVHTIPNTTDTNTGDLEPLLVTAISNNELKPEAYSTAYPDDIIYYCPDNDQSRVVGCTKGYIYRRIDTKQSNDFPFDFRQVKFRRWQINAPDWLVGTTYSKGNVVQKPTTTELYISLVDSNTGHEVTDTAYWRRFEWDNGTYVSWSKTKWDIQGSIIPCTSLYNDYHFFADGNYSSCFSNKLEIPSGNLISSNNSVVFGANFQNNSIGANFYNNSIVSDFYSNNIETNFSYNNIGANFTYNSIGSDFSYNSIGSDFSYNSIGANFYNNSIGFNFSNNSIETYFSNNSIETNFSQNSIGANFQNNSIGANFQNNSIETNFSQNSIGANFQNNSIGANFQNNSIGANFYNNSIETNFSYNNIETGFSYNNIETGFSNNSIGHYFYNNSIETNFSNNNIETGFYNNSIGHYFYNNSIGSDFSYNSIGANFYNNSIGYTFKHNNVLPSLNGKILTSTTELYNKSYPHTISKVNGSGIVITWYNSTGVLQSLFVA